MKQQPLGDSTETPAESGTHDLLPWWMRAQLSDAHREIVQGIVDDRDRLRERVSNLVAEVNRLTEES